VRLIAIIIILLVIPTGLLRDIFLQRTKPKEPELKILILGASGMIGHTLFNYFSCRHETFGTLRAGKENYNFEQFDKLIDHIDAREFDNVKNIIANLKPDVIINCIGVVKQISESTPTADQIYLNSLTPHLLAELSISMGFRSINLSTDCVFSGSRGGYTEADIPDASDIYGLTKILGEVRNEYGLTIRTSTIGLELNHQHGLVEWFLLKKGDIQGFDNAIYSGLTTVELAKYLEHILLDHPEITGVLQMAAKKITKYDLLKRLSIALNRTNINILKNVDFECDRSLDGGRLEELTGYKVPSWERMIEDLAFEILEREARIKSSLGRQN
jgi:dTDP-4-dehydrorhamnose reductase